MDLSSIFNLNSLDWTESLFRMLLAIFFGFLIGIDRYTKNKPIEFRAYMIVSLTTCIVAIMGQELYANYSNAENVISLDLSKIIAGTLTGLGFLGAGAIIKIEDKQIIGSATGASIWASGIIGLAIGFGFYGLAFFALVSVMLILVVGGLSMKYFEGKTDKETLN